MTKIIPLFLFTVLLMFPARMSAQAVNLRGRVLEAKTKSPLSGAHVKLINHDDPAETFITSTDENGLYKFSGIAMRSYTLEATYVGCNMFTKTIHIDNQTIELADLLLTQIPIQLGEVDIEGSPPPAVQKADTTEFNAGAFKTNPDAIAEDLVGKLPGVIVTNGTVTAQGEVVQQVLVDGKPFFGSDPTLALRNLPADAIAKIQIFDKMSDQAEFTGFDDGQSVKTLNIITRSDKRNQQFGKGYGGYGEDDRYLAGGSANYFQQGTRLSAIGLSNNINQQNFSTQDLLGVVGNSNQRGGFGGGPGGGGYRGGGGFTGGGGGPGGAGGNVSNFLVGQQNGIATTNSIGMNYSDSWGSHLTINQSYFFNLTNTDNNQKLHMQYFPTPDSSTFYNENSDANSKNGNHRLDIRLEYSPDTLNSIIDLPKLYFQNNNSSSTLNGVSSLSTQQLINQTANDNNANTNGDNLSNHIVFRHKFDLPGRTISLDLGTGYNRKRGTTLQQAVNDYYQGPANIADTINQQMPAISDGYTLSSRLAYTEPLGVTSLLQLTYNPSYSKNNSDNKKYNFDRLTNQYSLPDSSLSNTYENEYTTQNAGIAYRLRVTGLNAMAGVSYQIAALRGQQQFPSSNTITRTFYDVLPNAMLMYNIAEHTNLRIFYRTSTQAPSISQLQNIVDNSNPLQLAKGNPGLNQSYSQNLTTRYSVTNVDNGRSTFLLLSVVHTNNYIGNATLTAQRDTILSGILMNRGTQLSYPVNLDDQWNVNSFFTHSIVVGFLKSNLNLTSGITFARTPGLINQDLNVAETYGPSCGAVLSSNVSENVDFTLSYQGNYNISRNTFEPDLNSQYYSHTATVKTNFIFWQGIVFRNEMDNALYSGLSGGYDKNTLLWNMSLGKKFFSKQQGELTASVVDLLNQNKSVNRTVTGTYVEDTQNNVLGRYFMLTFTYTVR